MYFGVYYQLSGVSRYLVQKEQLFVCLSLKNGPKELSQNRRSHRYCDFSLHSYRVGGLGPDVSGGPWPDP